MIFRLSSKLAKHLKLEVEEILPLGANPRTDWSADIFMARDTPMLIVINTTSLYCTLFPAAGIADEGQFAEAAIRAMREALARDGMEALFDREIAPESESVQFSKPLNRSVTASLNQIVAEARLALG